MKVIKVINACKEFRSGSESKVVLSNLNMNVEAGTIYALMGSSGCGKTTLISCLVGVKTLDRGTVQMFGNSAKGNNVRIGYMPQETALIGEFTISEMIWFYGTIFGLSSEKIEERLSFLSKLLELPSRNKMIRECSGGQQRRVSFALTLVHEPDLLILDEPTVGVDPLLRSKIWDFLVDITSTKQVTVLLSTHYIEEARQSTHIGLMRNGVQIAEDSPANILQITGTSNLEEAFLKLSEKQELNSPNQIISNAYRSIDFESRSGELNSLDSTKHAAKFVHDEIEQTNSKIISALLTKNLLQIARNIDVLFIATLIPLIGCICLHFGVGGRIRGLALGIVNSEVAHIDECFNTSLITTTVEGYDCKLNKVSCRFIDELNNDIIGMKFYKSSAEAFDDAKFGRTIGFLEFASNFTESLPLFNGNDFTENGAIQVHLDQTDIQKTLFVTIKLHETFRNFTEKLMRDCGNNEKAGNLPIVFEALYGELSFDLKRSIVPGFILAAFFALASYITSISLIEERVSGIWNRTLVAGAKPVHFLLSHVIVGSIILFIQFLEYILYTILFLTPPEVTVNTAVLLTMIMILTGFAGLFFGLLLSTVMRSSFESLTLAQFFVYPAMFLSGVMWPFEGIPIALQYFGRLMPFALSSAAFRSILFKDSKIYEPTVYWAFVVLAAWIIVQLFLCVWFIREKDETKRASDELPITIVENY